MSEQVLVIPAERLVDVEGVIDITLGGPLRNFLQKTIAQDSKYIPRDEAEEDPTFLQIIPYVVLTHNSRVLQYTRMKGSGESRLRGKQSIGFGGHINPEDGVGFDAVNAACVRELNEELVGVTVTRFSKTAVIRLTQTPVDQVHIGYARAVEVESPDIQSNEHSRISIDGWVVPQAHEGLESWSKSLLEAIPTFCDPLIIDFPGGRVNLPYNYKTTPFL